METYEEYDNGFFSKKELRKMEAMQSMEVDDSTVDMIEAIQFLTQFVDAAIIDDLRYYTCGVDLATVSVVHDVAAVNWILEGF